MNILEQCIIIYWLLSRKQGQGQSVRGASPPNNSQGPPPPPPPNPEGGKWWANYWVRREVVGCCKRAMRCSLIANRRSQANRDFSCVRCELLFSLPTGSPLRFLGKQRAPGPSPPPTPASLFPARAAVQTKRRAESGERRAESGERRAESGERRAESGERRAESGERRAESGERRAESGERRAESGERRAESGERRAESGEQRAESEERRAESLRAGPILLLPSLRRQNVVGNSFYTPSQEWSISNLPCSFVRNFTSHSMKNLAFHSLPRLKIIIIPILASSLTHISL